LRVSDHDNPRVFPRNALLPQAGRLAVYFASTMPRRVF
jgi:hypothetical protein